MYLPRHTRGDDADAAELLAGLKAADLISWTRDGLFATFLPLIHQPADSGLGTLLGHVARRNDHWRLEPVGESLVIVHGPDAYITPSWYATKQTTGRVVPTWNYLTAHIYGELRIHDDPIWLERVVRMLTDRHETGRPEPWTVDDAPRGYIDGLLKAIVGVELSISRMEVKAKFDREEPEADRLGAISGLRANGQLAAAAAMSRSRPR